MVSSTWTCKKTTLESNTLKMIRGLSRNCRRETPTPCNWSLRYTCHLQVESACLCTNCEQQLKDGGQRHRRLFLLLCWMLNLLTKVNMDKCMLNVCMSACVHACRPTCFSVCRMSVRALVCVRARECLRVLACLRARVHACVLTW